MSRFLRRQHENILAAAQLDLSLCAAAPTRPQGTALSFPSPFPLTLAGASWHGVDLLNTSHTSWLSEWHPCVSSWPTAKKKWSGFCSKWRERLCGAVNSPAGEARGRNTKCLWKSHREVLSLRGKHTHSISLKPSLSIFLSCSLWALQGLGHPTAAQSQFSQPLLLCSKQRNILTGDTERKHPSFHAQ